MTNQSYRKIPQLEVPYYEATYSSSKACDAKMKTFLSIILLFYGQSAFCAEVDLFQHEIGIWSIQGTAEKNMWVIIHNLKEAKDTGVFHIEVIARKVDDPAWKIEHVVKHMAITKIALSASVLKPLHKGAVYPETFDNAFEEWRNQNSGRGGYVCTTSIIDCMKN